MPKNTGKAMVWALRVFNEWRSHRNKFSKEQCPEILLEDPNSENLNYWLSQFVIECRREDGKPYPAASISNILAGLYRYSKGSVCSPGGCPNLRDPCFRELTGAIQVRYRELRETGVGAVVKHAALVTPDEENMLWESKVIGDHSPLALQ